MSKATKPHLDSQQGSHCVFVFLCYLECCYCINLTKLNIYMFLSHACEVQPLTYSLHMKALLRWLDTPVTYCTCLHTLRHTHTDTLVCKVTCRIHMLLSAASSHRLLVTPHPLNKRTSSWAVTGRLAHAQTYHLYFQPRPRTLLKFLQISSSLCFYCKCAKHWARFLIHMRIFVKEEKPSVTRKTWTCWLNLLK